MEYVISKDKYTSAWTTEDIATKTQYPQVSNYWYNSSNLPIEDLHFGRPKELYFNITRNMSMLPLPTQTIIQDKSLN